MREQLSTQELSASANSSNAQNCGAGRILDLKTGTVKKESHSGGSLSSNSAMRGHLGTRRSFICRVRLGHYMRQHQQQPHQASYYSSPAEANNTYFMTNSGQWASSNRQTRTRNVLESVDDNELLNIQTSPAYSVVHITGYTKIWPPGSASYSSSSSSSTDMYTQPTLSDESSNFHLIAIARIQMTSAPTDLINAAASSSEFVTRHDATGLITFVDQKVTSLLGYEPSEMLKRPLTDFCSLQDEVVIKEQIKLLAETAAAKQSQSQSQPQPQPPTVQQQFTLHFIPNGGGEAIKFKTSAFAFCNPCNEAFEFIVCTHVNPNRQPHQQQQQQQRLTSNNDNYSRMSHSSIMGHSHHMVDALHQQQHQYTTSAAPVPYQQLNTYNLTASGYQLGSDGLAQTQAIGSSVGSENIPFYPAASATSANYLIMSNNKF